MAFFWNIITKLCWGILSLRYKISVKGLDKLFSSSLKKGILFLPNHQAHMDPLFLFLLLWPRYKMHPVTIDHIFRLSFLKPLMKLVHAISIPSFDNSINSLKVKRANDAIAKVANGLKKGENYVLYPAGRLKSSGKETIGAASGAHALAQCSDVEIVLVRTSGLWGSSFSRALVGRTPDLSEALIHGMKTILKNLIFFVPRRRVEIEFMIATDQIPRTATRLEFNRYLENWFNQYKDRQGIVSDTEPLELISYSFWKKEMKQPFVSKAKKENINSVQISDETRFEIYAEIRRIINNQGTEIKPDMNLAFDLGLDSLNIAELIVFISKYYSIEEVHPEDIETVQDILEIAEGARGLENTVRREGSFHWPVEKNRPTPAIVVGQTIAETFLNSCKRMNRKVACGDDLVGVISYRQMKRSAIVLSLYFRKISENHIAVMLPASVAAYLVILALQFAGKVPVMLNWTLGSRYLEEMMNTAGAKTVISSWRFLDRISHVDFGNLVDKVQVLEEIRDQLSFATKLKGTLIAAQSNRSILESLHIDHVDTNSPAAILFTSGSEASPKGVPLSHQNFLTNQAASIECFSLTKEDVLFSALPPFHSFGFSVAGLLPLCGGLKVAFYPDPTDGFALVEGIERWNVTIFCSPPSFLKGVLAAAKKTQLKSVRMFVTGAEKAPQSLFDRIAKLKGTGTLVEGYGITECAPIITIARPDLPLTSNQGVGQPLSNIQICTLHLETKQPLPQGQEGEICVQGPNVFNVYLGDHLRDPFIQINDQKWYCTGDIGRLDEAGNLILSGRIKRFTKIGGEMISLGAVEDALAKSFAESDPIGNGNPLLAVIAKEKGDGRPPLVLFSTIPIEREEVNRVLQKIGFSRLVKISSVKQVKEIPLMGSGKVDYRKLEGLLNNRKQDEDSN